MADRLRTDNGVRAPSPSVPYRIPYPVSRIRQPHEPPPRDPLTHPAELPCGGDGYGDGVRGPSPSVRPVIRMSPPGEPRCGRSPPRAPSSEGGCRERRWVRGRDTGYGLRTESVSVSVPVSGEVPRLPDGTPDHPAEGSPAADGVPPCGGLELLLQNEVVRGRGTGSVSVRPSRHPHEPPRWAPLRTEPPPAEGPQPPPAGSSSFRMRMQGAEMGTGYGIRVTGYGIRAADGIRLRLVSGEVPRLPDGTLRRAGALPSE